VIEKSENVPLERLQIFEHRGLLFLAESSTVGVTFVGVARQVRIESSEAHIERDGKFRIRHEIDRWIEAGKKMHVGSMLLGTIQADAMQLMAELLL